MTSTYTSNQGIEKPGTGDQSGTWGGTVNTNMDIIDRAISGVGALTLTGSTTTLTTTDGTLTDGMYRVLVLGDGGDLGSDNTLTISPNDQDKAYLVYNNLTANRNAIFTQGTGANATVANGATAWIYADGAGSGAAVRVAMLSTEISDQDGDTKIQVEEGGDDDDTIRFDIAGAEDFTMTANTFTALSGSDIAIASGATITNSGTATGFGADAERAIAGVLQTNANFVDQVIFGPSVDGMAWNGAWSKASVYSSLMLATIEDEGSNTEINIWDLTEQTSGAISTTPLATVDLSAAATPTSIAAAMGYLIVGSEDGIAIIDPHSGVWAERTKGWPKTLSTSTIPALADNSVTAVAMGFAYKSAYDPRTGGYIPQLAGCYGAGGSCYFIIDEYGTLENRGTNADPNGITIMDGYLFAPDTANRVLMSGPLNYSVPIANSSVVWGDNTTPYGFVPDNAMDGYNGTIAAASADGLSIIRPTEYNTDFVIVTSAITRAYNTGFMVGDIRGAWLANSKTVDRSVKANTLTENGTVTEAAVASGTELMGYSGFSGSNYLQRVTDTDFNFGVGDAAFTLWFKSSGPSATEALINRRNTGASGPRFDIGLRTDDKIHIQYQDGVQDISITSAGTYADSVWHQLVFTFTNTDTGNLFVDGVLTDTDFNSLIGNMDMTSAPVGVGGSGQTAGADPATSTSLALVRISATAPTAVQVREMYDAEKGLFVANAECLLQSGSTDAVLDVDVDKLTGKVLVTQTDAITVFDGLVVDSKPTVNSGASEKGKLWGALRAEQNSANAYVTAPATDQRQVNEMVRGLASDLPKGIDLSKAKAWLRLDGTGTIAINGSYNIKSVTDNGTGSFDIYFGVPFKSASKYMMVTGATGGNVVVAQSTAYMFTDHIRARVYATADGADTDIDPVMVAFFGELENE